MNKRRTKIQVSSYYNKILANSVVKIRTTHKQSQTAFAKSCGISYSTLKAIENANGNPRLSAMSKIACYAGFETYKARRDSVDFLSVEGKWIRVEGTVKEDLRREARVAMLEANPSLKSLASADNGTIDCILFCEWKGNDLFIHRRTKCDYIVIALAHEQCFVTF